MRGTDMIESRLAAYRALRRRRPAGGVAGAILLGESVPPFGARPICFSPTSAHPKIQTNQKNQISPAGGNPCKKIKNFLRPFCHQKWCKWGSCLGAEDGRRFLLLPARRCLPADAMQPSAARGVSIV